MSKMKKIAAMTAALLISANTMGYLPQDSIIISNVTANAAEEEEITSVEINETNFPDENFRECVKENFDTDGDGVLSAEEIAAVTEIILHKYSMPDIKIVVSNLKGIEYFTNLEKLYCNSSDLTELDVSKNTALTELYCSENQLTSLDLSKNTALKELICNYNSLTSLDLSNNTALTGLYCSGNQFASLDLSSNTALTELFCSSNQLTYLDLSNNPVLTSVTCDINKLTSLDVSNNTALTELSCYNNQLTYLDVSKNTALTKLSCGANQLTSLDVSNNTALIELSCSDNQLTSLDLSNNTALDTLWCYDNQLTSLDLSNNAALTTVVFYENTYEITLTDNTFDLSTLPMDFDVTKASKWTNGTVDGNILTIEDTSKPITYKYDCGNGHSETFTLIPQVSEEITSVEINETNFPDAIFRKYVTNHFDTNEDMVLSDKEIAYVTEIEVDSMGISDLTGIENFKKLSVLYCSFNNLTTLDLSDCTALTDLSCWGNQLTLLDVSNNTALNILECSSNRLTSLDVSNNTALKNLWCYENKLTSLNVSSNTALTELDCSDNKLTSLDVSNNSALTTLYCSYNQLTSLDVSKNTALTRLGCSDNQLTSLDVSNNTALTRLSCEYNQLTSLDVSNNTALENLWCSNNQLTSLDLSNNTALKKLSTNENKYEITLTGKTFDLSTLPTGFDVTKASEWTNATVKGNILTVRDASKNIIYKYDLGNGNSETFILIPQVEETPVKTTTAPKTTTTATTTTAPKTTAMFTTTTFAPPSYSWHLSVYPYDKADTIYEIGEELDLSTICVNGYGGGENFHADIPYISLDKCGPTVTVDASEFDNTKPGTYTIYVKWHDAVDSFDVTVVESDNAETPAATATTPAATTTTAAPKTTATTTTTTVPLTTAMFTTTTFAPPSYSCSLSVYPYDEADTIYEIGEELDLSTICVNGHGTMTSFGSTTYMDIPYMSLADCSSFVTVDASEFDNTKPGTYTIYVEWYNAKDSFEVTVIDPDNPTAIPGVEINETNFPDSIFRQYVAEEFDINGDSVLSDKEIAAVTKIDVYDMGISDLTGIEYFENLAILECMFNKLTTLDISKNTALIELNCYHNQLTSLDVSDHTELIKLCFDSNNITSIDLSNNTALTELSCSATKLTSIDISNNTALTGLYCYDGQLTSLDISKNTALETLRCMSNQLTSLDVSNNTALTRLFCYNNQLTSLDISKNTALKTLWCMENQFTSLDLSNNTALEALRAEDNKYEIALTDNTFDLSTLPTGFDVSKASEWTNATVEGNILTIEDVTKAVTYKYDFGNEHSEVFTLVPPKTETPATTTTAANTTNPTTTTTTFAPPSYSCSLNVYPYDVADTIYEIGEELDYSTICVHGYGTMTSFGSTTYMDIPYISLDRCNLTVDASEFDNTKPGTYTIYVEWYNAKDSFEVTVIDPDNPTAIPGVEINETNFPDAIFRKYVAKNFDKNTDGRLSDKEIAAVTSLHLYEMGISDLTGIQHFENLQILSCGENNLTQLDISENTALTDLYCEYNNLTTLDTSNNVLLCVLDCHKNKLTKLDFSNNPELAALWCSNNQLTSLDVSNNTMLYDLACDNNQLASIDLSNTICIKNGEWGTVLNGNKHKIALTNNTFDLSTLPAGFDVSKASDWTNATVEGNILTIEDVTKEVTYTYDCGLGFSETFTLIPQIAETPDETTTTTAPETTTTATTTVTTTTTTTAPVTTTTPDEDLPQTGFSNLYNCIPVSAGALVLLGMYAVKKSRKEDEE